MRRARGASKGAADLNCPEHPGGKPMGKIPTRTRAASAAALCGLLLAGSLLTGLSASAATTPPPLASLVTVQNGTTDELGGGDYLMVKAGQATFGVVYGSPEHPQGSVTFVA